MAEKSVLTSFQVREAPKSWSKYTTIRCAVSKKNTLVCKFTEIANNENQSKRQGISKKFKIIILFPAVVFIAMEVKAKFHK